MSQFKRIPGIYKIRNIINGKVWIGSAKDLHSRKRNHKFNFRKNKNSKHLQGAYNKYGKENFKFSVLQYVEPKKKYESSEEFKDRLLEAEQNWIEFYESYNPNKGYNLYRIAGSPSGYKHNAEVRKTISLAIKKNYKKNPDIKNKLCRAMKKRYKDNPKLKDTISKAQRRRFSNFKNREKQALAMGGKPFRVYKNNSLIGKFIVIAECARQLTLNVVCISNCLNGKQKQTKGYTFEVIKNVHN